MAKEKSFNITELVNNSGCFDLQFRKDTRHERTGSPTYYRWKVQFIITLPKTEVKDLEKIARMLGCGKITATGNQARFSVQDIDDIFNIIIPHFTKHALTAKKKDFELWHKAAQIIQKNKGVKLAAWEKNDLKKLLQIHQLKTQHKQKHRTAKWLDMAQTLAK